MTAPSFIELFATLEDAVVEIHRLANDETDHTLNSLLADSQEFVERFWALARQNGNDYLAELLEECYTLLFKINIGEAETSRLTLLLSQIGAAIKPAEMVKLIIWDLDETLWSGTLAEDGKVEISLFHIDLIKTLTKRGIISSICSKNNLEQARWELEKCGLWDYFVFPHIDFTPKGGAVKSIIDDMQLRAVNVLFIDDNHSNLEEVSYYNQGIQTLNANKIPYLLGMPGLVGNSDPEMSRLEQYKLLEQRVASRQGAASNEDFLRESDIRVYLKPTKITDAERVHDMITRTNQLNFCKRRISLDELKALILDPSVQSETVTVTDRFGDHGVVGWYALRDGELLQFLFSCRIINLGIEQSVYAFIGKPKLKISGEVASTVTGDDVVRDWVRIERRESAVELARAQTVSSLGMEHIIQIYALGACDLYYMVGHMALPFTNVHFECNTFKGDTRGVNVATEYIRSCFEMTDISKDFCRRHFHNYTGSTAFDTKIFDQNYDYVCLSFHDDFALDIYQSRTYPDMRIVLSTSKTGSFTPILNPKNVNDFNPDKWLNANFEHLSLISPERFYDNLVWIAQRLPKTTTMILMTGPEFDFFRDSEPHNPEFRAQVLRLNKVIREFCRSNDKAVLVEMNDFIFERNHFTNFIMHLQPERSYALAMAYMQAMAKNPTRRLFTAPENRKIALWGEDSFLLSNYYAMCALNKKSDLVVVPGRRGTLNNVLVEDAAVLNGQKDKFFVVVTPCRDSNQPQKTLRSYGYREGYDYIMLAPVHFSVDWRE